MDSSATGTTHNAPQPNLLQRWARALHDMGERTRTRRLLAQMDERQLADCAISHSERTLELQKPFWR